MKDLIFAAAVIAAAVAQANAEPPIDKEAVRKMTLAERVEKFGGGYVTKPGSLQGSVVFVNCQRKADPKLFAEVISNVDEKAVYRITVEDGDFAFPKPKIRGSASLFVVDDANLPALLSAPEDRWAMVNVARLSEGVGAQEGFFKARVKKELTRGFCLLAGTQDSNYKNSLLGCKTKPEDLDRHVDCRLPVDIRQRFKPYLAGYGVTPAITVSYRQAVREGWAASPTNDVQKQVWNKVHELPKNPIKIKYDPKTGK